jgi:hypothetical protein
MNYYRLSEGASPQGINSSLEKYYGQGLYAFSASIAAINEYRGVYDPYHEGNEIIYGHRFYTMDQFKSYLKYEKAIEPNVRKEIDKVLREFDTKFGYKKKLIEINIDFRIAPYTDRLEILMPGKILIAPSHATSKPPLVGTFTLKIKKGEFLKVDVGEEYDRLIWGHGIKFRDRIVGIWAEIFRDENGVHWENIFELLNWFSDRLPGFFLNKIGDFDIGSIKKQYQRRSKMDEKFFKLLRKVFFPEKRKNPRWTLSLGENYVLWIRPSIYTDRIYTFLEMVSRNIVVNKPAEFWQFSEDIGLHELKRCFEFCRRKGLSKLPVLIFINQFFLE